MTWPDLTWLDLVSFWSCWKMTRVNTWLDLKKNLESIFGKWLNSIKIDSSWLDLTWENLDFRTQVNENWLELTWLDLEKSSSQSLVSFWTMTRVNKNPFDLEEKMSPVKFWKMTPVKPWLIFWKKLTLVNKNWLESI